MRRTTNLALLTMFLATTSGGRIHAQDVSSVFDNTFNFSALKTYYYTPQVLGYTSIVDRKIMASMDSALSGSGYVKDTSGSADFLVGYGVQTAQHQEVNSYGSRWNTSYNVYNVTNGTLIMIVVDPAKQLAVWRGNATEEVNQKDIDKDIHKSVTKLISKYLDDIGKKH